MYLILDFSKTLCIAIVHNNIFFKKEINTKKNISEVMFNEIFKFFKTSKKDIKKLKKIYILTGPGSFTGIRSSLTFAKTLRVKLKLEIYGLSKFEFLNFSEQEGNLRKNRVIFLHFKDNKFFIQSFNNYKPTGKSKLINIEKKRLIFDKKTSYIYDNKILRNYIDEEVLLELNDNFRNVSYNLNKLPHIIKNNMIENNKPRPLYVINNF